MITQEEVLAKVPIRFSSKIKFANLNDCWEWMASKNHYGYGQFYVGASRKDAKMVGAHRFMYKIMFGEIGSGKLFVCHSCDNGGCVNPNHFFLGTQLDNMRDMTAKDRHPKGEENYSCKITEGMAIEIKKKLNSGQRTCNIYKEMGVSKKIVEHLKEGKTWKHLSVQ